MIPYASRTGSKRNLDGLRKRNWRLLLSPEGRLRTEGFPYCLDNGAWTAFTQKREWDEDKFVFALEGFAENADFVVLPDIVMGGPESLELSLSWKEAVFACDAAKVLIPVQDGMVKDDLRSHLNERVGVFIGGSTEWKLSSMRMWGELSRETGSWLHVGRVNSALRIFRCAAAGVHSFDGTSATRYAKHHNRLDHARKQPDMFGPDGIG